MSHWWRWLYRPRWAPARGVVLAGLGRVGSIFQHSPPIRFFCTPRLVLESKNYLSNLQSRSIRGDLHPFKIFSPRSKVPKIAFQNQKSPPPSPPSPSENTRHGVPTSGKLKTCSASYSFVASSRVARENNARLVRPFPPQGRHGDAATRPRPRHPRRAIIRGRASPQRAMRFIDGRPSKNTSTSIRRAARTPPSLPRTTTRPLRSS